MSQPVSIIIMPANPGSPQAAGPASAPAPTPGLRPEVLQESTALNKMLNTARARQRHGAANGGSGDTVALMALTGVATGGLIGAAIYHLMKPPKLSINTMPTSSALNEYLAHPSVDALYSLLPHFSPAEQHMIVQIGANMSRNPEELQWAHRILHNHMREQFTPQMDDVFHQVAGRGGNRHINPQAENKAFRSSSPNQQRRQLDREFDSMHARIHNGDFAHLTAPRVESFHNWYQTARAPHLHPENAAHAKARSADLFRAPIR